jgi:hypothetical protein
MSSWLETKWAFFSYSGARTVAKQAALSAPLHICAITAEDILFEHSFKATGADCYSYRDGTAFSAVATDRKVPPVFAIGRRMRLQIR